MAIDESLFREFVGSWTKDADRSREDDVLARVCADERLWEAMLLSAAENPRRSPANAAAIAEARVRCGYRDCLELRTAEEWRKLGGTLRRSVTTRDAICVTRRVTGPRQEGESPYRKEMVYPAQCVVGLKGDRQAPSMPARALEGVAGSMRDGVDDVRERTRLFEATEGVDLESLTPIADYVVLVRYGGNPYPLPDPPDPDGVALTLRREFRTAARACGSIDRNLAAIGRRDAHLAEEGEAATALPVVSFETPPGPPKAGPMTPDQVAAMTSRILRGTPRQNSTMDRGVLDKGGSE